MPELAALHRVHIIGAGGAGMSGLAKLLRQMGHEVTGSDIRMGPALAALADLGIDVWSGSRPERIEAVDLVVASSAVPDADPEFEEAGRRDIVRWRRPQLLAALTRRTPAIGATGTHGKTTSSALLVAGLRAAGRDPSFLVGGTLTDLGTNAHLGAADLFVLEADEAFRTFESLVLSGLMVTNVEPEHLEHFDGSEYELEDAFTRVVRGTDGPVVVCGDDPGASRLAERTGAPTYGERSGSTWLLSQIDERADSVAFRLTGPGLFLEATVGSPGRHMARNAAGVLALLAGLGHDVERAAEGLARFRGVRRRFEHRGVVRGVTLIDDYAHHPTEVAATIRAARRAEFRRLWAVFQPHLYSRTERFHREFGQSLSGADEIVVTDVFGAREEPRPGVTGRLVADAARRNAANVTYVPHRADLAAYLAERVGEGDLVLTMGAGDITLLADELSGLLAER